MKANVVVVVDEGRAMANAAAAAAEAERTIGFIYLDVFCFIVFVDMCVVSVELFVFCLLASYLMINEFDNQGGENVKLRSKELQRVAERSHCCSCILGRISEETTSS